MYDITDRKTYLKIDNWINLISDNCNENSKIIIIGNKLDKVNQRSKREVEYEEAKSLSKKYGLGFIETSAFTNYNVSICFEVLCQEIINNYSEIAFRAYAIDPDLNTSILYH